MMNINTDKRRYKPKEAFSYFFLNPFDSIFEKAAHMAMEYFRKLCK